MGRQENHQSATKKVRRKSDEEKAVSLRTAIASAEECRTDELLANRAKTERPGDPAPAQAATAVQMRSDQWRPGTIRRMVELERPLRDVPVHDSEVNRRVPSGCRQVVGGVDARCGDRAEVCFPCSRGADGQVRDVLRVADSLPPGLHSQPAWASTTIRRNLRPRLFTAGGRSRDRTA